MVDLLFSGKTVPGIKTSFWYYIAKSYDNPAIKKSIYRRILESDKSLSCIFQAIIEEIPRHYGFNRCCVKFPVFVNYIPELTRWYPNCKIIHITRDPRAMAMSRANFRGKRRIKNREAMLSFAVMQYQWTSRLHKKYERIKNYTLARYEDLLMDPEYTIKKVCEFADLEFVPQMLEPEEGQESSLTREKNAGFNKQLASNWRKAIHPYEKRIITICTQSSMKRFGYSPRSYPF
jgi:hypothetical protein